VSVNLHKVLCYI